MQLPKAGGHDGKLGIVMHVGICRGKQLAPKLGNGGKQPKPPNEDSGGGGGSGGG